jgi:hypothetical protein
MTSRVSLEESPVGLKAPHLSLGGVFEENKVIKLN